MKLTDPIWIGDEDHGAWYMTLPANLQPCYDYSGILTGYASTCTIQYKLPEEMQKALGNPIKMRKLK